MKKAKPGTMIITTPLSKERRAALKRLHKAFSKKAPDLLVGPSPEDEKGK